MSDAEKQEGQKTVVAFITGLLVGGLLVWVFASTPADAPQAENVDVTTEESANTVQKNDTTSTSSEDDDVVDVSVVGTGLLNVSDQSAGKTVTLDKVTYPDTNGWIVVRDFADGVRGKILGAARYSTEEGLTPTTIDLLRSTEKGSTYQIMFYSESGDKKFSTTNDVVVEAGATTFKAE